MEIQNRLKQYITEELQAPTDGLGPEDPLISSHIIDSLGMLSIVTFVESEFGVEISDEELAPENFETIASIAKLIESKMGERASQ